MQKNKYVFYKHPETNKTKRVKKGYSWTTLLFGCIPALCRGDFKYFLLSFLCSIMIFNIFGQEITLIAWVTWSHFYNDIYEQELINKGYKLVEQ